MKKSLLTTLSAIGLFSVCMAQVPTKTCRTYETNTALPKQSSTVFGKVPLTAIPVTQTSSKNPSLLAMPITNEDCTTAQTVTPDGTCVSGTTVSAADNLTSTAGCQSGSPTSHEDAWYTFTATGSAFTATITTAAPWTGNVEFLLMSGTCSGGLTLIGSNCGASPLNVSFTGLTTGTTYYFLISNDASGTNGPFTVCPTTTTPPVNCTDNDDCATPTPITYTLGTQVCVTDCNTGAATGPDFTGSNCYDFNNPTVWYSVTTDASTAVLDIDLTSTALTNPYFTVFSTSDCSNFTIISCNQGSAGAVSASVAVSTNTTYLIAVSDQGGLTGNFDLCLTASADNSACNTNDVLVESSSSDPATPVGGPYSAGETVNFCYTINQYQKANCNWLMGIVPTFGDCWDPSSFNAQGMPITSTPPAVAGNEAGTWSWYAAGAVTYNNITGGYLPPNTPLPGGWFFQCNTCGLSDPDPDNSWGDGGAPGAPSNDCDPAGNGYTWTVCFTLIAGTNSNCSNGTTNCGISIKTYADGEIGGYTNTGCTADLPLTYFASFACCTPADANAGSDLALTCTTTTLTLNGSSTTTSPTFAWTGPGIVSGANTATPVVNAPGTYVLSVSAASACTSTDTVIVTSNTTAPTASAGSDMAITCTTTSVTLNGTGSSGGMTYSWSGPGIVSGGTTTSPVVNASGNYTITVTDASNGCTSTDVASVTVNNTIPTANAGADMIITCSSPSVTLTGSSGTGGVNYSWSGTGIVSGGSTASAVVNAAGNYTVTITDPSNGCTNTDVAAVTVNTVVPNANAGSDQTLTCSVSSVTLTGSSTTGGATFSWAGPGGITGSASTLNTSSTGTFTLTVTDPANGCTATDLVDVVPDANIPNVNAGSSQTLTCTTTTVTLNGSSSTSGVTFSWSGPGIVSGGSTATPTVNAAGNYTLTVLNPGNGCSSSGQVVVNSNTVAPVGNAGTDMTITCTTTSVTLNGSSSTSGATYSWSGTGIVSGGTTATPTVNAAGNYTLIITDPSNGCTTTDAASVTVNTTPPNADAGTDAVITCTTTSVTLSGSSTTSGVTYSWSGPSVVSGGTTATPVVDASGDYTVTVTDPTNGCTTTDAASVTVNTTVPDVNAGSDQTLTCSVSSVNLTGSSATTNATFSWAGPTGITGSSATLSTSTTGTYTLTVTDPANGCTSTDLVDVIPDANLPDVNAGTSQTITCADDTLTINGSSATPGVTFSWSGPSIVSGAATASATVNGSGTYTLTVFDPANGCSNTAQVVINSNTVAPDVNAGSDQVITCTAASASLNGSSITSSATFNWSGPGGFSSANDTNVVSTSGTYTLVVSDPGNGCTSIDSVVISVDTLSPNVDAGPDQAFTCTSTTATLAGASSTTNASFSWSGPSGFSSTNQNPMVTTAGVYTLTVTDPANGCTSVDSAMVTQGGSVPAVSAGPSQIINCVTDTVTLNGTSNAAGAIFSWSGPGGFAATGANVNVTAGGTYTLSVSDSTGNCSNADSVVVTTDTLAPNINPGSNQTITCTTTSVTINGSSTTTGVSFSWSGPGGFTSASASDTVTATGTYTLVVTDPANGCTSTDSVIIGVNSVPPTASAGSTQVLTCSVTSATLSGSSGTSGVSYNWSGPGGFTSTSQNPTTTTAGTYTLVVTDPATGCAGIDSVTVSSNTATPVANANASSPAITCNVSSVSLTGSSVAANANYSWSGPAGSLSGNPATATTAGVYTVTVTDNTNGCTDTATVVITDLTQQPSANASATADSLNCANPSTTLNSSTTGVAYAWSGPNGFTSTQQNPAGVSATGTYTLIVTIAATGCTDTTSVTIYQGSNPSASFTANPTTGIAPLGVTFTNTSTGFTDYAWSFGDTSVSIAVNPSYIYTTPGTYTVVMAASNGVAACNDTASVIIVVQEPAVLVIPNVFTPNGDGINDYFKVTSTGYSEMSVEIFNRWGEKLATFNGINGYWDGASASDGTYYFMLKGTTLDGAEKEEHGYLLLAR